MWQSLACALLALALAGCMGPRETGNLLSVRSASIINTISGPVLQLSLDCELGETLRDALDHGIPLTFVVRVRSDDDRWQATRRVEMRYFPLSRRYVLRDRDRSDIIRSAVAPAYLVDALAALRIAIDHQIDDVPNGVRWHVDVSLERNALPGALRLPALLTRAWRLKTKEFEWTAGAG
ncbi:MAG: DUF4390 domain-containing protein [Dokdonella sp.]